MPEDSNFYGPWHRKLRKISSRIIYSSIPTLSEQAPATLRAKKGLEFLLSFYKEKAQKSRQSNDLPWVMSPSRRTRPPGFQERDVGVVKNLGL